jgi:hypothetical protein
MKKLFPFLFALLAIALPSCELLNKVDDVTFEVKLSLDFPVDEAAVSSSSKSYVTTQIIDATDNADVAMYKDKIKDVKISKITYVVSDYGPAGSSVNFSNGGLFVVNTGKTIATATSVALPSVTTEKELTIDADGINELAELLKNDKMASLQLKGTFSSTPVKFILKSYYYCTITAKAL